MRLVWWLHMCTGWFLIWITSSTQWHLLLPLQIALYHNSSMLFLIKHRWCLPIWLLWQIPFKLKRDCLDLLVLWCMPVLILLSIFARTALQYPPDTFCAGDTFLLLRILALALTMINQPMTPFARNVQILKATKSHQSVWRLVLNQQHLGLILPLFRWSKFTHSNYQFRDAELGFNAVELHVLLLSRLNLEISFSHQVPICQPLQVDVRDLMGAACILQPAASQQNAWGTPSFDVTYY